MPLLELLASPPGTGKTFHCIELFREKILTAKSGIESSSFFILPSREHADRIQNIILKKEIPGLFNAHILTINDLAERLIGFSAAAYPTDAVRRSIVASVLDETGVFEAVRDLKGFRHLLLDALKEFKQSHLGIAEFESRCQPLLKEASFRLKFRDFSVFLKNYTERLKRLGLTEPEDDSFAFFSGNRKPASPLDLLIFDGFYHFTRAQRTLLASAARWSSHMIVTLTFPADKERQKSLFEYPERTRDFLISIGFREKKKLIQNKRTADPALKHLETNLFLKKPCAYPRGVSSIRILEASDPRGEIELIAREIRRLYREEDIHYSDMCVILRSIEGKKRVIESVFSGFEIPFFIHEREKLIEKGMALTLYRFLNLVREGWKREDLFYFLKSSYLAQEVFPDDVLALERLSLGRRVLEGKAAWLEAVESGPDPDARRALFAAIDLEKSLLSCATPAEAVKAFRGLFNRLFSGARDSRDEPVRQALDDLLKSAESLYRRNPSRRYSAEEFLSEFQESLEHALFSLKPAGRNRVQVYDIVMALPKEYKTVFVSGLLEDTFPRQSQEDPLFKDAERHVINRRDIFLEERAWRAAGERYFFYMAVTRCSEKLYLAYSLTGEDEKTALPSFFVEEVKKLFADIPVITSKTEDAVPRVSEWARPKDVMMGLAEALFRHDEEWFQSQERLKNHFAPLFNDWVRRDDFSDVLHAASTPDGAFFKDPAILESLKQDSSDFSATRFEVYTTCAFKHFCDYTLALEEPLESRVWAEMGSILHRVLEEFFRELPESRRRDPGYWAETAKVRERLLRKLGHVTQAGFFPNEPLYRRKVYLESMRRALATFAESEAQLFQKRELEPAYFEWEFGKKEPRVIDGVPVKGQIDRIDLTADKKQAFIIDYKLSRRPVSLSEKFDKGLEMQLPLYLLAAQRFLGAEGIGAELRFLRTGDKEGVYRESARKLLGLHPNTRVLSEENWEEMLRTARKSMRDAATRFHAGDISIRSKSCRNCAYNSVCRFEPWKIVYAGEAS